MGSSTSSATLLAIIKDPKKKVYDQNDFNKLFHFPDQIICKMYDDFDQFIQKQSLKNLHNILIVQDQQSSNQAQNQPSYIKDSLTQYIIPIHKILHPQLYKSVKITPRQKLINYIKKYSLQYLNIFIYVKNFNEFVIPEGQLPYITMISKDSDKIINQILNEGKQKMINIKFKRLVKDLYRRKLVVVLSKDYHKKQKKVQKKKKQSSPKKQKLQALENSQQPPKTRGQSSPTRLKSNQAQLQILKLMQQNFKSPQNSFSYLFLPSIEQLWQKIKSMIPEFIICVDKQNLLQLIEFKKMMSLQCKLIYFGKQEDLYEVKSGEKDIQNIKKNDKLYQRKIKQLWWISNKIDEISPVMKKWWNSKTSDDNVDKTAKNIVIYLSKCQNLIKKREILIKIRSKIKEKKGQKFEQQLNITIQWRPYQIIQRLRQDLYTIVVMFDATYQQFQQMKKLILIQLKASQRIQMTLVEIKDSQSLTSDQILQKRVDKATQKQIFQFKFQISPIQCITCINLDKEQHDFFQNKMGLKVNKISSISNQNQLTSMNPLTNRRTQFKMLSHYFPQLKQTEKSTIQKQFCSKKLHLPQIFDNFYIVCSLQTYQKFLFPYLTLMNYYDKQLKSIRLPEQKYLASIINYLQKIKIIIYQSINLTRQKLYDSSSNQQKHNLNFLLKIHQSSAEYKEYLMSLILNYLKYLDDLEDMINKKKYKRKSDLSNNPVNTFTGANFGNNKKSQNQNNMLMTQQSTKRKDNIVIASEIFNQLMKYLDKIHNLSDVNPNTVNMNESFINTLFNGKIRLPNVQFVHYRLNDIQQYLNFCKYTKLSFSFFPKGSLKNFFISTRKTQSFAQSRSFSLQATFISNNQLLKKVFQQKNIEVSSKHQMQFIKFSLGKLNQIENFEEYVRKYSNLWKLRFQLTDDNQVLIKQNLNLLKNDIVGCFRKCRHYELLKISVSEFKHFYIDKINQCQTLLDLQIASIYIYSLPHGISDIINSIFSQPMRTNLSIQIFCGYLLTLFINFFSFQTNNLQKISTVIYIQDGRLIKIFQSLRESQIVFNKNILHLLANENQMENTKNHCIFIDYQNVPLSNRTNICSLLKIQRFSFYKQSAEYLLAPFTKLKLIKKQIINGKYKLHFQVIHDLDTNIFLAEIFKLNNINQIALFDVIDENLQQKDDKKNNNLDNEEGDIDESDTQYPVEVKNNSLVKNKKVKDAFNIISEQINGKNKNKKQPNQSLYRQAEQLALQQQKQNVKSSIQISLNYLKFLQSIKTNKLFSAQKYFSELYHLTKNSLSNNQKKSFQQNREQVQIQKLRIQKSIIHVKMHQYSKALYELQLLDQFLIYQKIQDKNSWIHEKVKQMQDKINKYICVRESQIQKIQPQKRWLIEMDDDEENQEDQIHRLGNVASSFFKNETQQKKDEFNIFNSLQLNKEQQNLKNKCKIVTPTVRWKAKYDQQKQTFIIQNLTSTKQIKINVFQQLQQDQKVSNSNNQNSQVAIGSILITQFDVQTQQKISPTIKGKGTLIKRKQLQEQNFIKNLQPMNAILLKRLERLVLFKKKISQLFNNQNKLNSLMGKHLFERFIKIQNRELDRIVKEDNSFNILNILTKAQLPKQTTKRNVLWKLNNKKDFHQQQLKSAFQELYQICQKMQKNVKDKKNPKDKKPLVSSFLISESNGAMANQKMSTKEISKQVKKYEQRSIKSLKEQNYNEQIEWIDNALDLRNCQKIAWSVFEFQNKLKIVTKDKKFKQKIGKGNKNNFLFHRNQNQLLLKTAENFAN